MSLCIQECDFLAFDVYHVSTDVLCDSAGLASGYVCITDRTVVYEIVCRTIIAERRGVRYVYSSNLQNKRFLYGQNA